MTPEAELQIAHTDIICRAYLFALQFVISDTARSPTYFENHLLSYVSQDFLQSIVVLPTLVRQGIHSVCRRELRFLLEMSIKLCRIQQEQPKSEIAVKLASLTDILDTTNIGMQKQIVLELLPPAVHEEFRQQVARFYGETSAYVHLTRAQVLERIRLVDAGRTSGMENAADIEKLNRVIAKGLSLSLVFLFHSVPQYAIGDLLVQKDGASLAWYFAGSKFIADIDEQFDYKAERQTNLEKIKQIRREAVRF